MDFKNIREIHVLDPWYHLYKIEQIIGRGIRLCSHSDIKRNDKRNVTVYLHTSSIKPEIESIDTNTYRIAEEKASQIGTIEKILKENAIDSILNKQINHIKNKYLKDMKITPSRKMKSNKTTIVDVNDKDYSKICSFIKCGMDIQSINKGNQIDESTYTLNNLKHQIKLISKIISEIYRETTSYILEDILKIVNDLIDTSHHIIYHSLDYMIDNKISIWNNNRNGYIIKSSIYYVFQPREEFDISIPLYYRNNKKNTDPLYITYNSEIILSYSNNYTCSIDYNSVYQELRDSLNEGVENIIKEYNIFEGEKLLSRIITKSIIDRLPYEKKVILFKEILCD